ncbi:unnamed protein product, partial [Rotaria magnacalcarata]
RLIGQIVLDYFTNFFDRNSRDYREVSKRLGEMKARDKIAQQDQRRRSQAVNAAVSVIGF